MNTTGSKSLRTMHVKTVRDRCKNEDITNDQHPEYIQLHKKRRKYCKKHKPKRRTQKEEEHREDSLGEGNSLGYRRNNRRHKKKKNNVMLLDKLGARCILPFAELVYLQYSLAVKSIK